MVPQPEATIAIEVQGSLHLESPGAHTLRIECDGDRLRLRVPSWRAAREALKGRSLAHLRGPLLHRLHTALCRTALQVDVLLGQRVVARVGPQIRPTLIARALGLGPFAIYPWAALVSLFDRRG